MRVDRTWIGRQGFWMGKGRLLCSPLCVLTLSGLRVYVVAVPSPIPDPRGIELADC
jgi:hypothetical protein